jgi:hypothetical protein
MLGLYGEEAMIKRGPDGSFILLRNNAKAIRDLNTKYRRLPGELRWMPAYSTDEIFQLKDKHKGKICNIIGKGRSLDTFSGAENDGPVIAINEAIHVVEALDISNPLYCLTQDIWLKDSCLPKKAALLLNENAAGWYPDYDNKYHFCPSQFGLPKLPVPLSALCAMRIAELMGCSSFEFHCFDASTNNDTRYAKAITYDSADGGDPIRFLKHKAIIEKQRKLPIRWVGAEGKAKLLIKGHRGIGDNFYQRPVIKKLAEEYDLYLETPWPEIYHDIKVKFVKPTTILRTQNKNIARYNFTKPINCKEQKLEYTLNGIRDGKNVLEQLGVRPPIDFKYPIKPEWIEYSKKFMNHDDFVVIRPVTIRKEWENRSRNCLTKYLQIAINKVREAGVTVVGLADLKADEEWLVSELKGIDFKYYSGEVPIEIAAALMQRSIAAIGPVGFMLPMGIAVSCPTFIIFGGSIAPQYLLNDALDTSKLTCAAPQPFCNCLSKEHNCDKLILNFAGTFDKFWRQHGRSVHKDVSK